MVVPTGLILRQNPHLASLLAGPQRIAQVGSHLEPLPGYRWDRHGTTLVIALKSGCPYCEASMGFYGRIADLWRNGALNAYPLVLYSDPASDVRPEIRGMQRITRLGYSRIGIASTPTVLLVDSQGIVVKKWPGQLPLPEVERLLASLRSSSGTE